MVFFLFNYDGMRSMLATGTLSQPLSPDTKLQQLSEEDYGEMVAEVFVGVASSKKLKLESAQRKDL
jgi:hypothetical protein